MVRTTGGTAKRGTTDHHEVTKLHEGHEVL
jgi:hypothetical protein